MTEPVRLNWGIVSTGKIAATFTKAVARSQKGRVAAVASRTQAAAEAFARVHKIPRAHGSYEALFADPEIQAVYIATPHPQHAECVKSAARAGKAILCEKPLGVNAGEVLAMMEAARKHNVLLMEAFMYRCHPQTEKIIELIRKGVLGTIGLIQATFSFYTSFDASSRYWSRELGGGGILDVGCYPVSLARLIAGASAGKPFLDPQEVTGAGRLHSATGVDIYAAATLKFESDLVAQVATGVGLEQDNSVRIYGTEGWLHVPEPWVPSPEGGKTSLFLHRKGHRDPEKIKISSPSPLYALEADVFAVALESGAKEVLAMSLGDTLGNALTLDRWRTAVGMG